MLDHRQTDLKARTEDRKNRLSSEISKAVTDKKQEEIEPLYQENAEELKQLMDVIAGIKTKLSDNDSARAKIAEKQGLIDPQKKECNRWDKLHGLIGSVRNLSGGESFIVSLSLALGLSRMASRKVRVDSLFLDEGFGTLDEESLETALETLAGLHQGGKLIGIISHVAALKERISTQISVKKVSGGKSKVSGSGCQFVS